MAVYSIKNISASAVVWSSQTIQPNEAIDINYENLYDKTTDLGISQDAINVSTLAQEDKILLCIDDVASTKEDTLEFIRELHNKNNVLEIPTKFLPSKHSYNWEKVGNNLSHLGNVEIKGTFLIDDIINSQIQLKNSTNLWDFRVGDTGDLIFKSSSVEKLRFKTDGSLNTSNGLVVTESPYFTDGWVSVPSSWIHSGITVTESFQYRVNEVGTIEFSGRGQNNTNTSSRAFTIFNANAIPTALRPSKLQRGALACEVGGVTRTNYYYMATTGQLSIYKDVTASGGTFSANECKVSITTLNYQIQG